MCAVVGVVNFCSIDTILAPIILVVASIPQLSHKRIHEREVRNNQLTANKENKRANNIYTLIALLEMRRGSHHVRMRIVEFT